MLSVAAWLNSTENLQNDHYEKYDSHPAVEAAQPWVVISNL